MAGGAVSAQEGGRKGGRVEVEEESASKQNVLRLETVYHTILTTYIPSKLLMMEIGICPEHIFPYK